jgi:geranylgeranylglycerol-phosphate geranylgeranyltransferase
LFALFVVVSFLPFVMGWFSSIYLLVFVPMDLVALYLVIKLVTSQTAEEGRTRLRQLYLAIVFFVIAFIIIRVL